MNKVWYNMGYEIDRVFDLGVLPDGTAYFVMDLVLAPDGEPRTLEDVAPDDFSDADRIVWLSSLASALDAEFKNKKVAPDAYFAF